MKSFILVILIVIANNTFPQQSKLSKTVNHISQYIASEQFIYLTNEIGDLAATDSIYIKALQCTEFDYSESLLALMLATVPYREVPIQIPLINSIVFYPLTSADEETFLKKKQ